MSKPFKLFVDAHFLDKEYQGTYTFIEGLYGTFLNAYPHVDVYFGTANPQKLEHLLGNVKPENLLRYGKGHLSILRYLTDIPRFIYKHKFDYAHFQYICPPQVGRCKYAVTLHDVLFNDFSEYFPSTYRISRNFLFGQSIKHAAIKTTVSAYSQERIAKHYKLNAADIHVLPNGIKNSTIADKDTAIRIIKDKFGIQNYILYVSRVEPRKNHELLLKTYLQLELYKKNIALVFIGKSSLPVQGLQQIIHQLQPEQRTYFFHLEQVEADYLDLFYRACRVFVYPSKAEGFGIPPLEAAVQQVPVLCSSATAMEDFDFFKPYVFDPDNAEEFSARLQELVDKPPTNNFMANVAHKINQQYNWQQTAAKFYNLLQHYPYEA